MSITDVSDHPQLRGRYESFRRIAHQCYGARDKLSGEQVQVKHVQTAFADLADAAEMVREVRVLRHFRSHPNIANVRRVLLPPPAAHGEWNHVIIVRGHVQYTLDRVIRSRTELSPAHVAYMSYQLFSALRALHGAGVVHGHIAPLHVLVSPECHVSLAGLRGARDVDELAATAEHDLDGYTTMRWYRAPELLVCNSSYGPPADMWSTGCVLAEMLTRKVLFPARDPMHELKLIPTLIGLPARDALCEVVELPRALEFLEELRATLGDAEPQLGATLAGVPEPLVSLIRGLLQFDSRHRLSAAQALSHAAYEAADEYDLLCPRVEPFRFERIAEEGVTRQDDARIALWREAMALERLDGGAGAEGAREPPRAWQAPPARAGVVPSLAALALRALLVGGPALLLAERAESAEGLGVACADEDPADDAQPDSAEQRQLRQRWLRVADRRVSALLSVAPALALTDDGPLSVAESAAALAKFPCTCETIGRTLASSAFSACDAGPHSAQHCNSDSAGGLDAVSALRHLVHSLRGAGGACPPWSASRTVRAGIRTVAMQWRAQLSSQQRAAAEAARAKQQVTEGAPAGAPAEPSASADGAGTQPEAVLHVQRLLSQLARFADM